MRSCGSSSRSRRAANAPRSGWPKQGAYLLLPLELRERADLARVLAALLQTELQQRLW
jgi:hypothetical protein